MRLEPCRFAADVSVVLAGQDCVVGQAETSDEPAEIAITLVRRGRAEDGPEIAALLRTAHKAARSHGYDPEVVQIEQVYQQIFGKPIAEE